MPPHIMLYLVKWQGRPPRTRGALPKIRGSPYPSRVTPLFLPEKPRHIPRLPNEIIHLIIENFDNLYDLATLATLCRVSKDFLLPSRKALYATVSIFGHFEPSEESCKILCDSLTLHPHLAALVRRIEMRPGPDTSGPAPPHTICIPNYSYLKKLAPICTAADSLHVSLRAKAHLALHGEEVLETLRSFAPRLKHLELDTPGQDLATAISALFQHAKCLVSLTFLGPLILAGEPPTFELNELTLTGSQAREHFETLTQSSTSSLHTLHISAGSGPTGQKLDITRFSTLRTLRFIFDNDPDTAESLYSQIQYLPLLHLDLRVYAHDGHRHHKAYLAIPPNLPPTLTHLRLDVPGIDDIVKFLNSATCPLLVIAEFGLPSEPNPWTRIEVARAAKQRGLRVIEEEPMWDDDYEEDEGVDRIETRQMVLEEFWK